MELIVRGARLREEILESDCERNIPDERFLFPTNACSAGISVTQNPVSVVKLVRAHPKAQAKLGRHSHHMMLTPELPSPSPELQNGCHNPGSIKGRSNSPQQTPKLRQLCKVMLHACSCCVQTYTGSVPNGKQEPTRDAVNITRHESLPHMHPRLGQHAITLRLSYVRMGQARHATKPTSRDQKYMKEKKSGMNSLTDNKSCLWKKLRVTEEL